MKVRMKLVPPITAIFVFLVTGATPVIALDANNRYFTYLVFTCSQYTQARVAQTAQEYGQIAGYISGYLTAYNLYTPNMYRIVPDIPSAALWLDNYCRAHPQDKLDLGLLSLTLGAKPKAQILGP
jgi:hypothetical protein